MKNLRTMLFGQLHQPVFVNILANFFHLVLETLLKILPVFQKDTYTHTHTHTHTDPHMHTGLLSILPYVGLSGSTFCFQRLTSHCCILLEFGLILSVENPKKHYRFFIKMA